jgi:hypothetical protein
MDAKSSNTTRWWSPLRLLIWLRDWLLDIDYLTPEEARRRMRSKPGFFASLSPEAREFIKNYDGPENLGPPLSKRRQSHG